ncbi:hypothetical protein [Staphylococcus phage vB_StaM_PB50]|nr:hypothetical protein [Staphylococcus phage vB_StaM_PB50]
MLKVTKLKELEYPKEVTIELNTEDKYLKEIKDAFFNSEKGTFSITKLINENVEDYLKYSKDGITSKDIYKLNIIVDKEEDQQITLIKAEENNQFKEGLFYVVSDILFGPMPVYVNLEDENATFDLSGMFKADGPDIFQIINNVFSSTIEINK